MAEAHAVSRRYRCRMAPIGFCDDVDTFTADVPSAPPTLAGVFRVVVPRPAKPNPIAIERAGGGLRW
jgi:hypothetical protein